MDPQIHRPRKREGRSELKAKNEGKFSKLKRMKVVRSCRADGKFYAHGSGKMDNTQLRYVIITNNTLGEVCLILSFPTTGSFGLSSHATIIPWTTCLLLLIFKGPKAV